MIKARLQKELDHLTKLNFSYCNYCWGYFLYRSGTFCSPTICKSLYFALGMIVAFIPEGLLPTVTLSLAMAVQRMAKSNALVKNYHQLKLWEQLRLFVRIRQGH